MTRVAIVGGSLGGLFAGLLLRRAGFDVQIYERAAAALSGRGAGIVTHDRLRRVIAACGLSPDHDLGAPVGHRVVYAADGSVVATRPFPQANAAWDGLYSLLRAAVPAARYHGGKAVAAVVPHSGCMRVSFEAGDPVEVDVVVAADGFRSTLRAAVLPEVLPQYAGYIAWRGLVDEAAMSPSARAALFDTFSFCLPPGEHMLAYPVAGADGDVRPGHRRLNLVWYRPAQEVAALSALLTDTAGRRHDLAIPPPLIRPTVVAEMRDAAHRLLAPAFAEAMDKTPLPFFQPIYDLAVPRMVAGRVALLGDCAFLARPHVGAGVTKAAEDAEALARCLSASNDIAQGLAAYNVERLAVGARIIARARHLGASLQAAASGQAGPAPSPEAVMVDTASLAFLDDA